MRFFMLWVGFVLIFSSLVFTADVDGKWTGTISTPGGDYPVSFTFKADGNTLTGTMSGQDNNQIPIKDGKINGNNISFSATIDMGGNQMNLDYKGVVSADQLKMSLEVMGQAMEFDLKKTK